MVLIALLRHGPTEWNETGRVQSRTDMPLSVAGRAAVSQWHPGAELEGFQWIASPLRRAVETAELLATGSVATDDRLREMDWGVWEGMTLNALRVEIGNLREAWLAEGLDFRAPGGESQREVQDRLRSLFGMLAEADRPMVAVCHRGVIRATYSLATGWDQTTSWPETLRDGCAQLFTVERDGNLCVQRLNLSLEAPADDP